MKPLPLDQLAVLCGVFTVPEDHMAFGGNSVAASLHNILFTHGAPPSLCKVPSAVPPPTAEIQFPLVLRLSLGEIYQLFSMKTRLIIWGGGVTFVFLITLLWVVVFFFF